MPSKLPEETNIKGTDASVLDFWQWAYSDLLSNRNRGILAEFLVGNALRLTGEPRIEWDKADFFYRNKYIEVKSSAYIQAWEQRQDSKITFGISEAKAWDYTTGIMSQESKRNSDCYVFCVYTDRDKDNYDILDMNHWDFYALSTYFLNKHYPEQQTISLSTIQRNCTRVGYHQLKEEIDMELGF